jgi:hypothetical protein
MQIHENVLSRPFATEILEELRERGREYVSSIFYVNYERAAS